MHPPLQNLLSRYEKYMLHYIINREAHSMGSCKSELLSSDAPCIKTVHCFFCRDFVISKEGLVHANSEKERRYMA